MSERFDVVVLGGGIGGYTAAVRLAQLGKTVAIIEKDKLGGTCLHKGCIPSKALLRSAEIYSMMASSDEYGIETTSIHLNFQKVQQRKQAVVDQLHASLESLMKSNKIKVIPGAGRIIGPAIFSPRSGAVAVEKEDGDVHTYLNDHLIIATGSRPKLLPDLEIDGTDIMTSDEALLMEQLPRSIVIIGGGVIGVEWASMLSDFGVEVTIVESERHLLPHEDEDISRELERLFKKRNINIVTGAKLLPETVERKDGQVSMEAEHKGKPIVLSAEKMLVAIGRAANVEQLGLENTGVKLERGFIKVNAAFQTSENHIYAIGDVNGGLQLAHAASYEGRFAAEHIAGLKPQSYGSQLIPRCVYSRPETASVGWTEKQATEMGLPVKTGKFHFRALGKAHVLGNTDGFVKVIANKETNDILGVHMIGPHVTDYISEAVLAQVLDAVPWEVATAIHPHPSLSEALSEAMWAAVK